MNKKQVGALLKVMGKDDMKPALMHGLIDEYEGKLAIVATNGYALAIVYLDGGDELVKGTLVRRESIEKWYKLATGKSRLNGNELERVIADEFGDYHELSKSPFPQYKSLIPEEFRQPAGAIAFNAVFISALQELDGGEPLTWNIGGALQPVLAKTDRGVYLFMPKKQ